MKRIKRLSEYEDTLIWMSYKYAINKHTINSNNHAYEIAKNSYYRLLLTPKRMQFMSKDINTEIQSKIAWFSISFKINNYYGWDKFGNTPLGLILEFINNENIKDISELNIYSNINVNVNSDGSHSYEKINNINSYGLTLMDIEDLMPWQILSNIFDLKHHKFCKLNSGNKEQIVEYINIYQKEQGNKLHYKQVKIDINKYLEDLNNDYIIHESDIVEDNLQLNTYNV